MNPFIGLDSATLATLKTAYTNAIVSLAQNQAYSLNGRSLTRSNLNDVKPRSARFKPPLTTWLATRPTPF
jgi:hypothetical protein